MNEEINVNNGGGLYDNVGLIDTLILDCNLLPKALMIGNYVQFCSKIMEMVQKLSKLKEGVQNDLADNEREIQALHKIINEYEVMLNDA